MNPYMSGFLLECVENRWRRRFISSRKGFMGRGTLGDITDALEHTCTAEDLDYIYHLLTVMYIAPSVHLVYVVLCMRGILSCTVEGWEGG